MGHKEGQIRTLAIMFVSPIIAALLVRRHFPIVVQTVGAVIGIGGLLYGLWWARHTRD
jgi:hypothetical protein